LNPKRDKKMTLKRFYKELLALVVVGYMGMGMAFAAGTITGVVTDKEGAPLAFANVVITHKIVNREEVALRSQLGTVASSPSFTPARFISIFDWPDANQTSPIKTFLNSFLNPSEALTFIV